MRSLHELLDEAEKRWRAQINRDFPLRAQTPVIKDRPTNSKWDFRTDMSQIFATINKDDVLRKEFEEVITKYWQGSPDDLAIETLHYILYHELYHPLEAPFSIRGENNDNKRTHQAIRRGLIKAQPELTPQEQLDKLVNVTNLMQDFILDNRVYLENLVRNYFRKDIVPSGRMINLIDVPVLTTAGTITMYLYSLLYGTNTNPFFAEHAQEEGQKVAMKALEALLNETPKTSTPEEIQDCAKNVRQIFTQDRYAGIERFISVIAPYIFTGQNTDTQMDSPVEIVNGDNILDDLLDDMTPEEQDILLKKLQVKESPRELTIPTEVSHEYYKRNHPKVSIVGGSKVGETQIVGKRKKWHPVGSRIISKEDLGKYNLENIARFQRKTRLPMLVQLPNGLYRINDYEIREQDIKDVVYVDSKIDIPDMVEFYLDRSGSMHPRLGIGSGSRWDMLSSATYGFIDALCQGSVELKKRCLARFHVFAMETRTSEVIDVLDFWRGNKPAMDAIFSPCDERSTNLDINIDANNLRRTYLIATDGEINDTQREADKMRKLARNSTVILFEIGGCYSLGKAVMNEPNIHYYPVHDKQRLFQEGLKVLLSK